MAKTRTTVGTQIMRAIEDERLPSAIRTGLSKALLGNGEIVDQVLEELVGSLAIRAERLYDYAKGEEYAHGLPSGQFTNPAADAKDAVILALQEIEGAPVTIDYLHWGAPNNLHIGWMHLVSTYNYSPVTNKLGTLSTTERPVFLHDMVVVIPGSEAEQIDPVSLEQWGIAAKAGPTPLREGITTATAKMILPSPVEVDATATYEYLRVTTARRKHADDAAIAPPIIYETIEVPVTGFDEEKSYFHVRYTVGGVAKYWMYEDGAGTWPLLDEVFDKPYEDPGSFFPFAYFRYNKKSEISDKSTLAYRTSKKLVSYIGMDYDDVAETINMNPDIADVEQAMLMFAVPANTANKQEQRYLWEFFNNMYLAQDTLQQAESSTIAKLASDIVSRSTSIRTTTPSIVVQDKRFKLTLRNNGIYRKRVAGTIGPVGTYASGFNVDDSLQPLVNSETGVVTSIISEVKTHYYRRQVTKGIYDELRVVGLATQFHVFDGWFTLGDEEDDILLIPLDHSISEQFSLPDREELYARSLHFVFNSRVVTKVKWYQTGLFKAILIVVAIVITVITQGATTKAVIAAIQAGLYSVAATILLTLILEMVIYTLVFRLFVKVAGVKIAFIVAIIAAVLGVADALQSGSIEGAPFAAELLTASTGITAAMGKQLSKDMEDLLGDYQGFTKYVEEQTKTLETAKELLDGNVHLSPFVVFGEKPDDYYNRTVHASNIGLMSIDAVSSFVDVKLSLPKLSDTLGIEGV